VITAKKETEIQAAYQAARIQNANLTIGFVPTMGALHQGHISLIEKAKLATNFVVCSIFVNPTQFNNASDLETYPRTIEADIALLKLHGCDLVFIPSIEEVYPGGVRDYEIDLEGLDQGMEGQFRPGHFKGVCMVVERLFEIVTPQKAFFGAKDFQQLAIIRKMTTIRNLPIAIISVPIKRAENGLALSSRNALLSAPERENAKIIYQALQHGVEFAQKNRQSDLIREEIATRFDSTDLVVEYIAIVDNDSLLPVDEISENSTICIVVFYHKVRLIDNIPFSVEN